MTRSERITAGRTHLAHRYGIGVNLPRGYTGLVRITLSHPMSEFVTSRSSVIVLERRHLSRYLKTAMQKADAASHSHDTALRRFFLTHTYTVTPEATP